MRRLGLRHATQRRYEQTNARASHVLVPSEEQALAIRDEIAAGLDFSEAAVKCAPESRPGGVFSMVRGWRVALAA